PRPEERLLEVDRILNVDGPREMVAVPDEMLRDDGAIAARNAVPAQPPFLQMRRRDLERAAFPLAGGEAHRRVLGELRRMRTAVHPDRPHRVPREVLDVNRDQLLRDGIDLLPDPDVGEAVRVIGGMDAALIVRQRQDRRAPALRAKTIGVVQRQPGVVAELRPGNAVGIVLAVSSGPNSREVDLRLGDVHADERYRNERSAHPETGDMEYTSPPRWLADDVRVLAVPTR